MKSNILRICTIRRDQFSDGVNLCIADLRSISIALVHSDGLLGADVGVGSSGQSERVPHLPMLIFITLQLMLGSFRVEAGEKVIAS